jgi:hypothetical protein
MPSVLQAASSSGLELHLLLTQQTHRTSTHHSLRAVHLE